jgi:hypothetical protein
MATVEARNAARLETFLESDGRISATIRQRFDSGALSYGNFSPRLVTI